MLLKSLNSETFSSTSAPTTPSTPSSLATSLLSSSSTSFTSPLNQSLKLLKSNAVMHTNESTKPKRQKTTSTSHSQKNASIISKQEEKEEALYCICQRPADEEEEDMMIECDECKDWLHGKCVNLNQRLAADIEIYVCPRCVSDKKQIIYKNRKNYHRHDYSDANALHKPTQAGTKAFIEQLLARTFPDAIEHNIITKVPHGQDLTLEYFEKNGFERPLLIESKEGLGFVMPSSDEINLTEIENIVGSEYGLGVIDVERQEEFPMSIKELNEYFKSKSRTKTYNLISFEISKTKLTESIEAPSIVHELSWVSNGVWPKNATGTTTLTELSKDEIIKPEVQKYCLISAEKSYTDFHIDFGGSSVWYHLVKGDKLFYLIEPTDENLKIYENWYSQKNHNEIFLADKVNKCYKFEIKAGNTILLPTGWIHAVYTPYDSLVFGGNFLQSYKIPLQFKCYEMELRLKTHEKYRFPAFETLQWYAAKFYTQKLKEVNQKRECISNRLYHGLKYLNNTLKRWINSKDYYQIHDHDVPRRINCDKLMSVMAKELAKAENFLKSQGLYTSSENSLKLKIKLPTAPPTPLQDTTTTTTASSLISSDIKNMFTVVETTTAANIITEPNQVNKVKKKKEVLNYGNMNLLDSIKLENDDANAENTLHQDTANEEPIKKERIIMKLKTNSLTSSTTIANDSNTNSSSVQAPIKLKIKISNIDSNVAYINPNELITTTTTTTTAMPLKEDVKDEEPDEFLKTETEDEEELNELKNSYTDGDFVYPSLNKKDYVKHNPCDDAVDGSKKSTRKRKLKPHAMQYLLPKEEAKPSDTSQLDKAPEEKVEQIKKPKKLIDRMIEKNLKPSAILAEAAAAASSLDEGDSADKTYKNDEGELNDDEEDEYNDDDEDFKLKCKNNLKLSKKITKNLIKHQKKLDQDTQSQSLSPLSKKKDLSTNLPPAQQQNKNKSKKGLTTAKQRLGKLLKLNRAVNI